MRTVLASSNSKVVSTVSPELSVMIAVAPGWKFAPLTVICACFPTVALGGDKVSIFGAGDTDALGVGAGVTAGDTRGVIVGAGLVGVGFGVVAPFAGVAGALRILS